MAYRTRINYTARQRSEIWDRWQRGEPLNAIGRAFDQPSSSIFGQLVPTGGIHALGPLCSFKIAPGDLVELIDKQNLRTTYIKKAPPKTGGAFLCMARLEGFEPPTARFVVAISKQ